MFLGSLWDLVQEGMDLEASWLEKRTQGIEGIDWTPGHGARRALGGSRCVPSCGGGAVGIWWRCEGIGERSELAAPVSQMEEVLSCCSLEDCCCWRCRFHMLTPVRQEENPGDVK